MILRIIWLKNIKIDKLLFISKEKIMIFKIKINISIIKYTIQI
jgi:hypothetical protein